MLLALEMRVEGRTDMRLYDTGRGVPGPSRGAKKPRRLLPSNHSAFAPR